MVSLRFSYCFLVFLICVALAGCGGGKGTPTEPPVLPTDYTVRTLDTTTGLGVSYAYQINDEGQIVGSAYDCGTVMWDTNGAEIQLDDPAGIEVGVSELKLNNQGIVAGTGRINEQNLSKTCVVVWSSDGQSKILKDPNRLNTYITDVCGVTEDGRIICFEVTMDYTRALVIFQPDGRCVDVTPSNLLNSTFEDCNESGYAVGNAYINNVYQAIAHNTSTGRVRILPKLPESTDADYANAVSINKNGLIVGHCFIGGGCRWVMWDLKGKIHDLGLPPGCGTGRAFGINDQGVVVGSAGDFTSEHAYSRLPDGTWVNLGALAKGHDSIANSINNLGQIVGFTYDGLSPTYEYQNMRAVIWDPVPTE